MSEWWNGRHGGFKTHYLGCEGSNPSFDTIKIKSVMTKNDVKKYLYKNKELMAEFSHYVSGNLYYNIQLEDGVYQFPIPTVEDKVEYFLPENSGEDEIEYDYIELSSDLGTTSFDRSIKASFLNRWVDKSFDKGEFIRL